MSVTCKWQLTNEGVKWRARMLLRNVTGLAATRLKVGLVINNHTFAFTDLLATYTEPSVGSGYARKNLDGSTWTEVSTASGQSQWSYPVQQWNFTTGGFTLYGAFLFDEDRGELIAAGQFFDGVTPNPFAVPSAGGIFQSDFVWTDDNCP